MSRTHYEHRVSVCVEEEKDRDWCGQVVFGGVLVLKAEGQKKNDEDDDGGRAVYQRNGGNNGGHEW